MTKQKLLESGIINRKSGELVHEITRDINSETSEKDITFYNCKETNKTFEDFSGAPHGSNRGPINYKSIDKV